MKVCSNCGTPGSGSFCTKCGGNMVESNGDDLVSSTNRNFSINQSQPLNDSNSSSSNNMNHSQEMYQPNSNYSSFNYQQPLYQASLSKDFILPMEYQPISPMGYFGYSLLFGLPLVGFVALLIIAFGGTKNINLRNYARGLLIPQAIIWGVIAFMFAIALGGASYYFYR